MKIGQRVSEDLHNADSDHHDWIEFPLLESTVAGVGDGSAEVSIAAPNLAYIPAKHMKRDYVSTRWHRIICSITFLVSNKVLIQNLITLKEASNRSQIPRFSQSPLGCVTLEPCIICLFRRKYFVGPLPEGFGRVHLQDR